jgi:predicted N-formylglutamate amidohydrolase
MTSFSPLLSTSEPPALTIERPQGASDLLFACDHASRLVPQSLGSLGLTQAQLCSHIAWDIGAAGVTRRLSALLDATAVLQNYSRLVIDCNRPPGSMTSIATQSEYARIAGNDSLGPDATAARVAGIFAPYHENLAGIIDQRRNARRRTVLIAMHSFTPEYLGEARPWHVGLLYRHDKRLGSALLEVLRREPDLTVGDNEPYSISDDTDYTIPVHGESTKIAHVGIEIRQDLILNEASQQAWAVRLAPLLLQAAGTIPHSME